MMIEVIDSVPPPNTSCERLRANTLKCARNPNTSSSRPVTTRLTTSALVDFFVDYHATRSWLGTAPNRIPRENRRIGPVIFSPFIEPRHQELLDQRHEGSIALCSRTSKSRGVGRHMHVADS